MSRRLLIGHSEVVARWVAGKLGCVLNDVAVGIGVIDGEGKLIGGAVLASHSKYDAELHYFGPGTFSAGMIRAIAVAAFDDFGLLRVTIRVPRWNKAVIHPAPKLGWRNEGLLRNFYGRGRSRDALVFGMLKADAVRLMGKRENERTRAA